MGASGRCRQFAVYHSENTQIKHCSYLDSSYATAEKILCVTGSTRGDFLLFFLAALLLLRCVEGVELIRILPTAH